MEKLPIPFFVDEEGHRYHSVADGARIIGSDVTSQASLWTYATIGHHPDSGLDLCVLKQPLLRTGNQKSSTNFRLLLREDRLLALRELLKTHRKRRMGPMSQGAKELMRDAARQFELPPSKP